MDSGMGRQAEPVGQEERLDLSQDGGGGDGSRQLREPRESRGPRLSESCMASFWIPRGSVGPAAPGHGGERPRSAPRGTRLCRL